MKILTIGAGSIGLLFSTFLAKSGNFVEVYGSLDLKHSLKNKQLKLIHENGKEELIPRIKNAPEVSENQSDSQLSYDFLIISCKSHQLHEICKQYSIVLKDAPTVFLLQNGLGNEEIIEKFFPKINIVRILTTFGAKYLTNGVIQKTGDGKVDFTISRLSKDIYLKNIQDQIFQIQKILTISHVPSFFHGTAIEPVWDKLLINICINAIGGITGFSNGDLLEHTEYHPYFNYILQEALIIGKKLTLNLKPLEFYLEQVFTVLKKTSKNFNSLLQDLQHQKKTEIQFLNGAIKNLGQKYHVSTPFNSLFYLLILNYENRKKI